MSSSDPVENNDYPFTSWYMYSEALIEMLSSEDYSLKYPNYAKYGDDYKIIVKFVEKYGECPQQILNSFIKILCNDGSRYGGNMVLGGHSDIIDYLLEKGATMSIGDFLEWDSDEYDYERNVESNDIRASIIDYYFPLLKIKTDEFKDIEAMDGYTQEEFDINDNDEYELAMMCDLKYKSKYLSGI